MNYHKILKLHETKQILKTIHFFQKGSSEIVLLGKKQLDIRSRDVHQYISLYLSSLQRQIRIN